MVWVWTDDEAVDLVAGRITANQHRYSSGVIAHVMLTWVGVEGGSEKSGALGGSQRAQRSPRASATRPSTGPVS